MNNKKDLNRVIVYHGTEKKRGEKMLADQKMIASISDDRRQHWLGDGIYLYRELFYAFRWIESMYRNHFGEDAMREDLLKKYSILSVMIDYDLDRIFNLNNPEHYIVFKKTEMMYRQKSAFSSKLEKYEYSDGVIINILFKNLKYGEYYDAVEAIFSTVELNEMLADKSRIKSISEYQLCVKNDRIINEIRDVTDTIDYDAYNVRILNFEQFRKKYKKKPIDGLRYVNGQRGGEDGKWQNIRR